MKSPSRFSREGAMWRIIKHELNYNSHESFGAGLFFGIMVLLSLLIPKGEVRLPTLLMGLMISPMIAAYAWDYKVKQKRDRFYIGLPLSCSRSGVVRILYPLTCWVILLAAYSGLALLFSTLGNPDGGGGRILSRIVRPSLTQILVMNGLIACISALYLMVIDLKENARSQSARLFYDSMRYVIPLLAILPFYLGGVVGAFMDNRGLFDGLHSLLGSVWTAGAVNLLGFCLSMWSVRLFCRRKTYTHT